MNFNDLFMRRALQLAHGGEGRVAPNPMVGAVIVADGSIIGEGFHQTFGGAHAEVNAIASVKPEHRHLLKSAMIYVTLEPCSHYGKTPPCAELIIKTGIPNVVVGAPDPNPLVAGRGIKMLRDAGIHVKENVLLEECLFINRRFMVSHTLGRPWIQLKWAQSADGYMAALSSDNQPLPIKFSNPLSSVWMHRQRALVESIMVGKNTMNIDHPRLNLRFWPGKDPEIVCCGSRLDLKVLVGQLHDKGVTSLMVEGGPTLLNSFINAGLFDELRIETAPTVIGHGLKAPVIPSGLTSYSQSICRGNIISVFGR